MVTYHEIRSILSTSTLQEFELESSSRSYVGYTLFMKHYYHFLRLDDTVESLIEGLESMKVFDDGSATTSSDDASSISTNFSDTISSGGNIIKYGYHQTLLSNIWNELDTSNQFFWNNRAKWLNQQPLLGAFIEVPSPLLENNQLSTSKVLKGLSSDWCRFVKICRASLLKDPSSKQSTKTYTFLNEKVTVGLQSYRKLSISTILMEAIFGTNFEAVQDQILYQTKKRVYINFSSYENLKSIFEKNNYSAVKSIKAKNTYLCCGKVNVTINKRNILGYVIDEDANYFKVLLVSNMGIRVKKPLLVTNVQENGKIISARYDYGDVSNVKPDTYVVTYFWPTRIKILINAIENCHILMNKLVLDENNQIQEQLCS